MSMSPEEFFAGLESRMQDFKVEAERVKTRAHLKEREKELKGE